MTVSDRHDVAEVQRERRERESAVATQVGIRPFSFTVFFLDVIYYDLFRSYKYSMAAVN